MIAPGIDHVAMSVPDLDAHIERLVGDFGLRVVSRMERFAVLHDAVSGLNVELSQSADCEVHFRHLGFRSDDLDADHGALAAAGMHTVQAPHRREPLRMSTSYLNEGGGLEVQLVTYDEPR